MTSTSAIALTVSAVAALNLTAFVASTSAARASEEARTALRAEYGTLIRNLVLLVVSATAGLWLSADSLWHPEVPAGRRLALELVAIFLIDDAFFYAFHRALHTRFLFRRVHAVHHSRLRPVAIEYLYAHPVELLGGTIGSAVTMVVFGGISIVTLWAYLMVRTLNELRIHMSARRSAPPRHFDRHLAHHWLGTGNFCSLLPIWDRVFGTTVTLPDLAPTASDPSAHAAPTKV